MRGNLVAIVNVLAQALRKWKPPQGATCVSCGTIATPRTPLVSHVSTALLAGSTRVELAIILLPGPTGEERWMCPACLAACVQTWAHVELDTAAPGA